MDKSKIFRFNLSNELTMNLDSFTKINNHLTISDYKSNWEDWIIENSELINNEKERLYSLGYKGDIYKKMYKSARYYLSKKVTVSNTNTNKIVMKRDKYIPFSKSLLNCMDNYINRSLTNTETIKPSIQYKLFVEKNSDLIKSEIDKFNSISKEDI